MCAATSQMVAKVAELMELRKMISLVLRTTAKKSLSQRLAQQRWSIMWGLKPPTAFATAQLIFRTG